MAQKEDTVKNFLEYLRSPVGALMYGEDHVGYSDTREPIEYDYHMPMRLQPEMVAHHPGIFSNLTGHLVATLEKRKAVKDGSMNVEEIRNTFRLRNLVPREAVGEACVRDVQRKIYDISCPLATLSCFNIDSKDITTFEDVFGSRESSEINTRADLLVGCQPRPQDEDERWGSLWPSIIQPKDLRSRYFRTLYTEEYKNIRSGGARTILGIYIIIWCLHKGHLQTLWPQNDCNGCERFRKSHRAAAAHATGSDVTPPLDEADAQIPETATRTFKKELARLLDVVAEYDTKYNIPTKEQGTARKPRARKDQDADPVQNLKAYKQLLSVAVKKASSDLKLSETIREGLDRWVLTAAFILIQVSIDSSCSPPSVLIGGQVWAQMVRHNATVARLTCHNIGVLLTRHRGSQILGISDFLEHTDTPILQATALTVYAYHDAVERHDRHLEDDVPLWEVDPYRGETQEDRKDNGDDDDEYGSGADGGSDNGGNDGGDPHGAPGAGGGNNGGPGNSNQGGPNGGGGGGAGRSDRDARYAKRDALREKQNNLNIDLTVSRLDHSSGLQCN
ncbi:hypothetical protein B0H15DRAFT_273532 [Mycena belliarum]|uniref:Uncharacterized protein n=1 Tax=Mycena belliarum TaxID=1033014 RepID=A0AAD6U5U5_9AGAR|nr:hypothetical protein B0H15DRAFT_273532 [Mycena belliae]